MTPMTPIAAVPLADAVLRRREEIRTRLAEAEFKRRCEEQAKERRERGIANLVANLVAEYERVAIDADRLTVEEIVRYAGDEPRYQVHLVCEDAPGSCEYPPSIYLSRQHHGEGWTVGELMLYAQAAHWLAYNESRDPTGHSFSALVDAWLWVYEGLEMRA